VDLGRKYAIKVHFQMGEGRNRSALPTICSDSPAPYMSAVSTKLIP